MEGQKATISVVIPAFNAAEFLPRALRSALGQTRPADEIIVVDDGSSDDSAKIAADFGAPVRVVQQPNAGASAARNRGIAEASGDWVALLDADDEWLPEHLERALRVLERHPDVKWFAGSYEWRTRQGVVLRPAPDRGRLVDGVFQDYFAALGRWVNSTPAMVIRRSVFEEVGGFDTDMTIAEDLDLWFRIGLRFPRVAFDPEITVIVWSVEGSLMTRGVYTPEMALAFMRHCTERAEALGPESAARARHFTVRWTIEILRNAALERDLPILRGIERSYGPDLPLGWRVAGLASRFTPRPVWRGMMRVWSAIREARLRRLRRREAQSASRSPS